jgi:hypothetical protein
MALQGWDKNYREQLKIQEQEIESLQQQLMISGKGGSPGQPYDDPEKGKGPFVPPPGKRLMISHGEGRGPQPKYHDEYNQPLNLPPWVQMNEAGELIDPPWMKEEYLKEHPELASGPDYIGDKLRYGQLDRILNPLGNFQKPTLDQLRIHKNAYPKV